MAEPFPMIERSLREYIETAYPDAGGKTGGDPSYVSTGPGDPNFYVWISMVPGSGQTDEIQGSWAIDVEVLASSYAGAMTRSLDLEAVLLAARRFKASNGLIIDSVDQNTAPGERPWDDDAVYLVGGTYVVTARRSG